MWIFLPGNSFFSVEWVALAASQVRSQVQRTVRPNRWGIVGGRVDLPAAVGLDDDVDVPPDVPAAVVRGEGDGWTVRGRSRWGEELDAEEAGPGLLLTVPAG